MNSQNGPQLFAENDPPTPVDVAIVGAGLAGTTMATVLGKAGRKVALVDPHFTHHDEFRAEKTRSEQMQLFEKLASASHKNPGHPDKRNPSLLLRTTL
ncbi:FAD-dependent monooxygenase [Mesorhizobium sp. WSM3626]|uniref:FAD-dependent monooxygenase n=1 Tax=Mesorhizobium sp. WSM3626 TaxID=1040987 RepID=UPI0004873FF6|nr:FAD-dependent monooxygenase [Mesorhizobium sp. WSM3626]